VSTSDRAGFVYVIQDGHGLCKIGRARNPKHRLQTLATASSTDLTLIIVWPAKDAAALEAEYHQQWRTCRVRGEWFRIPDAVIEKWKQNQTPKFEPVSRNRDLELAKHTPKGDGMWWHASGSQVIDCENCFRATNDAPAVMKYDEARDWGGMQSRAYPEWPKLGWVVWRQCEHCSWSDAKTEYRSLREIQNWRVGPWWTS
jgi:hypothetical protein